MDDGRDTGLDAGGGNGGEHVDVISLVLGEVDSKRRTEMATHVLRCSTCRRDYDEMAATVRELLPAVPAVQPPLGFDQNVLGRLGISEAAGRTTSRLRWLAARGGDHRGHRRGQLVDHDRARTGVDRRCVRARAR